MIFFFLDGSALAKRYVREIGTHLLDQMFERVSPEQLVVLNVGIAEVVSVIVRRKNSGLMSQESFANAMLHLGQGIVDDPRIQTLETINSLVLAALIHIQNHSINATDAIVLHAALVMADYLRSHGDDIALVASDQRLLRAANAEKLVTVNPETDDEDALDLLLTS
jgi:predicted nucleic acid-binding protein